MIFRIIGSILLLCLSIMLFGYDYPTVPWTFATKEVISSSKTNANNAALKNGVSDGTKKVNFAEVYIAGEKAITDTRIFYAANELHVPGQYATLQAAITAATGAPVVTYNIVIDGLANCTATASIPSNVKRITKRAEGYLTITGQIAFTGQYLDAPPEYIFKGSGTVTGNITNTEIYPEWWGAVANITANATINNTAFNAIIKFNRYAKKRIKLPTPGIYHVSYNPFIVIYSNCWIEGLGKDVTTIKANYGVAPSVQNGVFRSLYGDVSNVTFKNLTMDDYDVYPWTFQQSGCMIWIRDGVANNNINILDCKFISASTSLQISKASNVRVENCDFTESTYTPTRTCPTLTVEFGDNVFIKNNYFEEAKGVSVNMASINCTSINNLHIYNNTIVGGSKYAAGILIESCSHVQCESNIVRNYGSTPGIRLYAYNGGNDTQFVSIMNNDIEVVSGNVANSIGINIADGCKKIFVQNNRIKNGYYAINVDPSTNTRNMGEVIIKNNLFENIYNTAINLDLNTSNFPLGDFIEIDGNTCTTGNNYVAASVPYTSNLVFKNNHGLWLRPTKIPSGNNYTTVFANNYNNSTTAAMYVVGLNALTTGQFNSIKWQGLRWITTDEFDLSGVTGSAQIIYDFKQDKPPIIAKVFMYYTEATSTNNATANLRLRTYSGGSIRSTIFSKNPEANIPAHTIQEWPVTNNDNGLYGGYLQVYLNSTKVGAGKVRLILGVYDE